MYSATYIAMIQMEFKAHTEVFNRWWASSSEEFKELAQSNHKAAAMFAVMSVLKNMEGDLRDASAGMPSEIPAAKSVNAAAEDAAERLKRMSCLAVELHSHGGSTGVNEYRMQDGSLRSMREKDVKWVPWVAA